MTLCHGKPVRDSPYLGCSYELLVDVFLVYFSERRVLVAEPVGYCSDLPPSVDDYLNDPTAWNTQSSRVSDCKADVRGVLRRGQIVTIRRINEVSFGGSWFYDVIATPAGSSGRRSRVDISTLFLGAVISDEPFEPNPSRLKPAGPKDLP